MQFEHAQPLQSLPISQHQNPEYEWARRQISLSFGVLFHVSEVLCPNEKMVDCGFRERNSKLVPIVFEPIRSHRVEIKRLAHRVATALRS